jgi:outer membrane protein OmpA-like peptidoglycan-associated protein
MKYFLTFLFLSVSVISFSQRNTKKLESSFDFGFGNHFGLRQIEEGFNVNSLTASNVTLGWTNYFTNNKFGGRLELSYDKMMNNSLSNPFQTNYFRSTYYLNASLKNISGWGKSNKATVDRKTFWQSFDIDFGMGIGYSAMKSKLNPIDETVFLKKADDMLNISFRIAPSLEISDNVKLFASYTRINHSAQSTSFDFTQGIDNTAFKGAFRTVNVGIRYTPNTERTYDRTIKEAHKKWHFFTSFDASVGNHFAGKTQVESAKFKGGSIGHLNVGANHKFPNSKLYGRFDFGFDAFKELSGEPTFTSKYFRTTYQVIADMRTLRGVNNEANKMDLAFGLGLGFATMYNAETSDRLSDIFLNGDDMYALVFSVNPSYRISKYLSAIANASFTSHSLQSSSWDMQAGQNNSALNGRFMNMSVGLRYHMADRRTNYTSEIINRIPRIWSVDAAVGSHFGASPMEDSFALSAMPAKHFAIGLNHPFINPIYFGRFEFAYDALSPNSSSLDFSTNYFRANYFLMTSVQNQLRQSLSSERPARKFDVQFGLGVGASTFKGSESNDYFITKGDDMLNLAAKVVPTYKISEKVSIFTAYTFVSHSLQSLSYDMNQGIDKTMFNGRLMNASVGVSIILKSTKPRGLIVVTPVDTTSKVAVLDPIIEPTPDPIVEPTPDPVVEPTPDPIVEPTPDPIVEPTSEPAAPSRSFVNSISDYPVNTTEIPESQKQVLKDLAFQLKQNKFLTVVVSGHTDITGTPEYNQVLSRKRAASVKAYLISQGVPAERVKIEYYGITKPIASNATVEGRKKNRRVDIEIVKN